MIRLTVNFFSEDDIITFESVERKKTNKNLLNPKFYLKQKYPSTLSVN